MEVKKIYDVSMTLSEAMPIYPDNPSLVLADVLSLKSGDDANVSYLCLGTHSGTHVDAPLHFFDDGYDVTQMPMEQLIGPVQVLEIKGEMITVEEIRTLPLTQKRILFKTQNTALGRLRNSDYDPSYVALRPEAAAYLLEQGVITFGIDYLSMEMPMDRQDYSPKGDTHKRILGARKAIIEGLDLTEVAAGDYFLVCLPTKLKDGNGSMARTVLLEF